MSPVINKLLTYWVTVMYVTVIDIACANNFSETLCRTPSRSSAWRSGCRRWGTWSPATTTSPSSTRTSIGRQRRSSRTSSRLAMQHSTFDENWKGIFRSRFPESFDLFQVEVFRQTVADNVLVGSYCALSNQVRFRIVISRHLLYSILYLDIWFYSPSWFSSLKYM